MISQDNILQAKDLDLEQLIENWDFIQLLIVKGNLKTFKVENGQIQILEKEKTDDESNMVYELTCRVEDVKAMKIYNTDI